MDSLSDKSPADKSAKGEKAGKINNDLSIVRSVAAIAEGVKKLFGRSGKDKNPV